jgi:hypothetical protein
VRIALLAVLLAISCKKAEETPSGTATATSQPAPDAAPPLATAASAPTFCDGKPCPCKAPLRESFGMQVCDLTAALTIQGVPCKAEEVQFHPDGRLRECSIASAVRVGPYRCVSSVRLLPNGALQSCEVSGAYAVGGYELEEKKWSSFRLEIYSDGSLRQGVLAEPRRIGKIACQKDVALYPTGEVYSCDVDEPFTHRGITFEIGTPAMYGKDGTLIGYFPQKDIPALDGGVIGAGNPVCIVDQCNVYPDYK